MSVETDPQLLPEDVLAPSPRSQLLHRAMSHKGLLIGGFIVGTLILVALFARGVQARTLRVRGSSALLP